MSDELEKRIRELWNDRFLDDIPKTWIMPLKRILRAAARIGAELEREACAAVVDQLANADCIDPYCCVPSLMEAALEIRARGDKR